MKLLLFQTIVLELALANQAETPKVHHHQGTNKGKRGVKFSFLFSPTSAKVNRLHQGWPGTSLTLPVSVTCVLGWAAPLLGAPLSSPCVASPALRAPSTTWCHPASSRKGVLSIPHPSHIITGIYSSMGMRKQPRAIGPA